MVGVVGMMCILMLLIPQTYKVLGFLMKLIGHAIYFAILFTLIVAITCNVHTYRFLGWTPMSLIFGDGIYDAAIRDQDAKTKNVKHR